METKASIYPESCYTWMSSFQNPRFHGVLYEEGCIQRLSMIINQSAISLGTGALAIVLIQVSLKNYFLNAATEEYLNVIPLLKEVISNDL